LKHLPFIAALLLSGCASVSISHYKETKDQVPTAIPSRIVIQPISALLPESSKVSKLKDTLYLDDEGQPCTKNGKTQTKIGAVISKTIYTKIESANKGTQPNQQELKINCRILEQQKGSRALRTLVGLGLGKTYLETRTLVYTNKSKEPWLEIWTTGGSNSEPGALFAAMPSPIPLFNIAVAAGTGVAIINGSNKGLTQDSKRTGKLIGAFILEKLKQSGLPIAKQHLKYLHSFHLPILEKETGIPFSTRNQTDTTEYLH